MYFSDDTFRPDIIRYTFTPQVLLVLLGALLIGGQQGTLQADNGKLVTASGAKPVQATVQPPQRAAAGHANGVPPRHKPASRAEQADEQRWAEEHRIAKCLAWLTTLYLIATIGILIAWLRANAIATAATQLAQKNTQASLELTRQGIEVQRHTLRARVGYIVAKGGHQIFTGKEFLVYAEFINSSQIPANRTDYVVTVIVCDEPLADNLAETIDRTSVEYLSSGVLQPHERAHVEAISPVMTEELVNQLASGLAQMFVIGRARYEDGFGTVRRTVFCAIFNMKNHLWANAANNNYAD